MFLFLSLFIFLFLFLLVVHVFLYRSWIDLREIDSKRKEDRIKVQQSNINKDGEIVIVIVIREVIER